MTYRGSIFLLGCLAACQAQPPKAASERVAVASSVASSASVAWLTLEPATAAGWLQAPARAVALPEATASVSAPMTARVLRVRVHPGQRVDVGEPMLDVLLPDLLSAAGRVAAAALRIEAYEARRQRLGPLVDQGLATAPVLSELDANLALARAERQAARATLRIAGVGDRAVKGLLAGDGSLSLRAPIAGMVVEVSARPGQIREPSSGALLELVGEGRVQIEAQFAFLPAPDLAYVWHGDNGTLPLDLEAVSPQATQGSATRTAWFGIAAEASSPPPNSLGTVHVQLPADTYVLPATALFEADRETCVVALRDGHPTLQPVRKLFSANGEVIVQGIPPDVRIAADGLRARAQMREHP